MPRTGLDKDKIVEQAARLANESGLEQVSLKRLAEHFGVRPPSLYNHIESLDALRRDLMLYGWSRITERIVLATAGVSGHEAMRRVCYAFYEYALENPGVFSAMLWYNRYEDEDAWKVTEDLFRVLFRIMTSLHISEDNSNHLIRTLRGLLQGFSMLVNNHAFGNPLSVSQSFELSVQVFLEGMKAFEEPFQKESC